MNSVNKSSRINTRNVLLTTLATLGLGLSAAICAAANEDPGYETATKAVHYGDLNLANPQAIEQLYQRIVAAAKEVCDSGDGRALQDVSHARACTAKAISKAVTAVGRPELAALYAVKSGRSVRRIAQLVPK